MRLPLLPHHQTCRAVDVRAIQAHVNTTDTLTLTEFDNAVSSHCTDAHSVLASAWTEDVVQIINALKHTWQPLMTPEDEDLASGLCACVCLCGCLLV
ncbi:MAG: hypothetical protein CME96_08600 [Hyphomonas sp.]|nr:hypothetical protein [Hyphomonas sp.]